MYIRLLHRRRLLLALFILAVLTLTTTLLLLPSKDQDNKTIFTAKSDPVNYKYPWELCRPMQFFKDPENHPLTALASFEGSGNTWVRYLLQQSTGIHTGSEDCGTSLLVNGFPGEAVSNSSVSVVKTHSFGPETLSKYRKAVLIIRDPGSAILANFNRLYSPSGGHTDNARWIWFFFNWRRFLYESLPKWRDTNLAWLQHFPHPLHVVLYDQLLHDLGPTLRSLVEFLGLPLDEPALQCTLERSEGKYHRKQQRYGFEVFDVEMLKRIKEEEDVINEELRKYSTF